MNLMLDMHTNNKALNWLVETRLVFPKNEREVNDINAVLIGNANLKILDLHKRKNGQTIYGVLSWVGANAITGLAVTHIESNHQN